MGATCLPVLLLFYFFGGHSDSGFADEPEQKEEVAVSPDKVESEFSERLRTAGEHHRKRLHLAMQLRVDEIDRSVRLSDTQRKKVNIAAKGAVDRVIDRWLDQMLKNSDFAIQFGQMQAEQAKASLIGMGAEIEVAQVTQEDIWKNGVNQQFDESQRERYQEMVAERRAFLRRVSIGRLVMQLDEALRFSDKQRQEITRIFDDGLDPKFTFQDSQDFDGMVAQAFQIRVAGGVFVGGDPDPFAPGETPSNDVFAKVSDERLAKVLSENQMKSWSILRKDPDALMSGAGNGQNWFHNGGGNIFIDGAVIEWDGRGLVE